MKAVILVGGLGTRLRPLTLLTPKSMVPVLNMPFLEHVLRRLPGFGITEVVLALSHQAPAIESYFGSGLMLGLDIKYVVEKNPLGTAGAARNALGHIHEACLIMNGDIFTGLDLGSMIKCHSGHRAKVTIALTAVDNPCAYGLVETAEDGRVNCFLEKPSLEQITTNMINAGTYVVEPEVLAAIPPSTPFSFERNVFPSLLARGEPVFAFADESYWIDIGTPAKYQQLNRDLLCGKAPLGGMPVNTAGDRAEVHPAVRIDGPVLIGEGCVLCEGVVITGPAVIGPGCRLDVGAIVADSILWHNVIVGAGCKVTSSILADNIVLGPASSIEDVVIGIGAVLPDR